MIVRPATPADHAAIDLLTRAAFADVPGAGDYEIAVIAGVRAEGAVVVELVADRDGKVVGHVLFSRMTSTPPAFIAALGPVAVAPAIQRAGVGSALIVEGLDVCRRAGAVGASVVGHVDYYPRFGFSRAAALPLASPYAAFPGFMALDLVPGGLAGIRAVAYPAAFG